MRASRDETAGAAPRGRIRRLRRAYERLIALPPAERRDAAERRHAAEPDFLHDLLRLLACDPGDLFLVPPSTRSGSSASADPVAAPGRVLAHRWRLVRRIGSGGQGVVWEALDTVSRGRVAVKLMRPAVRPNVERMSREAAALRWLRLPGVVRFLGDGQDGRNFWLAMEYVDGEPFPGRGRAGSWERVEPVIVGLLEALARVHGAGVVHGDIKPHNVLVAADGVVTLLDLGLATKIGSEVRGRSLGGTPGYVAPERADGTPPDVRSDLYSAGVLFFKSLARPSGPAGGHRTLPRRGVPQHVRDLIGRLLARDPQLRPASAVDALRSLRQPRAALPSGTSSASELRARFAGHDWFHHIREDAARELFSRTGGDPEQVEEELSSWMRAGLARIEGGLLAVDRVALDRLALMPGGKGRTVRRARPARSARVDAALATALRRGSRRGVVRAALQAGRVALAEGRGGRALSAMEFGSAAAQRSGWFAAMHRVHRLAVSAALATATAREIERALWLIQRSETRDAHTDALRDILRAAAANQAGDRGTAWTLSTKATRHGPASVRAIAWSVRALIAQALDLEVHRRAVRQGGRWARAEGTPRARRAHRTWRAWLAYRSGRCAEAMRLHLLNAQAAGSGAEAMRSLVDAAVAAKDAGDDVTAIRLARAARQRAAKLRVPVREARAYYVERETCARQGADLRPNLAALAAVDDLGYGVLTWNARMVESVIAWRRGDLDAAREILAPLPTDGDAERLALHELPVACLAVALGMHGSPDRVRELARRVVRQAAPALAVQCLALLAVGCPARRRTLARRVPWSALPARGREFERVREFLSVRAASALLGRR